MEITLLIDLERPKMPRGVRASAIQRSYYMATRKLDKQCMKALNPAPLEACTRPIPARRGVPEWWFKAAFGAGDMDTRSSRVILQYCFSENEFEG